MKCVDPPRRSLREIRGGRRFSWVNFTESYTLIALCAVVVDDGRQEVDEPCDAAGCAHFERAVAEADLLICGPVRKDGILDVADARRELDAVDPRAALSERTMSPLSEVQPLNALPLIVVTVSGMVMFSSIGQFSNQFAPIVTRSSGSSTVVSAVQFWNR